MRRSAVVDANNGWFVADLNCRHRLSVDQRSVVSTSQSLINFMRTVAWAVPNNLPGESNHYYGRQCKNRCSNLYNWGKIFLSYPSIPRTTASKWLVTPKRFKQVSYRRSRVSVRATKSFGPGQSHGRPCRNFPVIQIDHHAAFGCSVSYRG